jgi:hypothetical protein
MQLAIGKNETFYLKKGEKPYIARLQSHIFNILS